MMGKYSHYAEMDPTVEAVKPLLDEMAEMILRLSLDELRATTALTVPPEHHGMPMNLHIDDTRFRARDGTNIPLRIFRSPSLQPKAALFYMMHSGGWTMGPSNKEENMQRLVAGGCNAVVVSVDYRVGPEHRYPQAVMDCFDGLKWCVANASALGADPKRIIVAGRSAGASLAAVMALKARDENVPGIVGQVLNVPITCHPTFLPKDRYKFTSWEQNKDSTPIRAELILRFWKQYVGEDVKPEEHHSPLLAKSLAGLPPALVQIAGMDPLRDEAIAYADALKTAGVKTTVEVFLGMPHDFGNMGLGWKSTKYHSNLVQFVNSL